LQRTRGDGHGARGKLQGAWGIVHGARGMGHSSWCMVQGAKGIVQDARGKVRELGQIAGFYDLVLIRRVSMDEMALH